MALSNKIASSVSTAQQIRTPARFSPVSKPTRAIRCAASNSEVVTRRDLLAASVVTLGVFSQAAPAQAFLGFGDDGVAMTEEYTKRTTNILAEVRTVLDLARDDPTKEEAVKALRTDINSWVAEYRREPKIGGRQSYGQTYSALNALAGHYNSFGATAPLPKKRLERVNKELNDAALFLSRGR
eukprot:gene6533-3175_t